MATKLQSVLPWAALLGVGIWAVRRPEEFQERAQKVSAHLGEALKAASDFSEPLFERAQDLGPEAQDFWKRTLHASEPLIGTAGAVLGDLFERGGHVIEDSAEEISAARQKLMEALERARPSKKEVKRMEQKVSRELLARLAHQEKMMNDLKHRLERGANRPRRGGFSLFSALIGAGVYYLWRHPETVNRALESFKQANPEVGGRLERATNAVKDGFERIKGTAKDTAEAVGDEAKDAVREAKDKASGTAAKAGDAAGDAMRDVKRGAEAVGDHAQDAAKSVAGEVKGAVRDAESAAKDAARDAKRTVA